MKNIRVFYLKKIEFLEMKFPIYLNRRVLVMYRHVFMMQNTYNAPHRIKRHTNTKSCVDMFLALKLQSKKTIRFKFFE